MAIRAIDIGAAGRRFAANLAALRDHRRLSQADLAELLKRLGRPMASDSISKIETLGRRVDVDDLVALAAALDTTPNRLLLPGEASETELIELTPELKISALDAWKWVSGELLLSGSAESGRRLQALREGQPHHAASSEARKSRMTEVIEQNRPLVRMIAAVVDEARERGVSDMLLDLVGHIDVQRRFGLPIDGIES